MSADTTTPVALPLDQARAALEAAERQTDATFLKEFQALCQKHGRYFVAEIVLRGGSYPDTRLVLTRS
jgi:hypothetical protein